MNPVAWLRDQLNRHRTQSVDVDLVKVRTQQQLRDMHYELAALESERTRRRLEAEVDAITRRGNHVD